MQIGLDEISREQLAVQLRSRTLFPSPVAKRLGSGSRFCARQTRLLSAPWFPAGLFLLPTLFEFEEENPEKA
ncbi:Hypothetical predicted protein [Podarcis lilfordi]|uniref:Uncharacterized protein n=1 Tax=Podarcis lilfordi TaxID=74358 RepID=A0AA35P195_9SAUR|nr:Hypothetical predicted protein [Podarcis lilfordi]